MKRLLSLTKPLLFSAILGTSLCSYAQTSTFNYTGAVQTYTVPAGFTTLVVDAMGAAGGLNSQSSTFVDRAGNGARVQTVLSVTPGQVLQLNVGGRGGDATVTSGGAGGFNGGGAGSYGFSVYAGGGGGGATDVRIGGSTLADRVVVAAGGGGAGLDCGSDLDRGGDGGTLIGEDGMDGCTSSSAGGGGGSQLAGGAAGVCAVCSGTAGMPGLFGIGGDGGASSAGGGGGAGYYGGGGSQWEGGGGGSSYADVTINNNVVHTRGANTNDGVVMLTPVDVVPMFVNGSTQNFSVCQDAGAVDINSILAITDADAGQTETWSVLFAPSNGTLGGFNTSETSTGSSIITPSGLTYTPNPGFSGADAFTITIDDGTGNSSTTTVNITVNPTPDVTTPASQTLCNGAATTAVNFAGSVSGTTFDWTNNNIGIGLAASGSGNIPSFIATNATSSPITGEIMVTPTANGCMGATQTFSVTVNPTPDVITPANQAVCNGATSTAVNFTGSVAGTTYTWTNDNTTIGLATSGTGNIAAFTATNTGTTPQVAIISVTPEAAGCMGTPQTFSITVNPTPDVTTPGSQTVCNGTSTTTVNFAGSVAGTTFDWTNNDPTIGLAATGTGDIAAFTATNTTADPVIATIMVTPSANGCAGASTSFTITVNPTPMLSSTLTPAAICDSTLFSYNGTSLTSGTVITWRRPSIAGITNPAAAGIDSVREILINTTANPIVVTYVDSLVANGCSNVQNVTVTVNPKPTFSSTTSPAPVCDNTVFTYTPTSLTSGTTYSWSRDTVAGIANGATVGTGGISETLHNVTADPIVVTYLYTLFANGCTNTQNVMVTINPTPVLSSTLTPPAICDSTLFSYMLTSATTGTTHAWSRDSIVGIANSPASGVDSIREVLYNTTTNPITVLYKDTLRANGCMNIQTIGVAVNPKPTLSSVTTPHSVCSGNAFIYAPTSATSGVVFTWSRAAVPGISNPAHADSGAINETLINTTSDSVMVVYIDTLKLNGCMNTDSIKVFVKPTPKLSSTHTPSAICDSFIFNYPPTSATAGATFAWTRPYILGIGVASASGINNPNEQLINNTNFDITVLYLFTTTANGCTSPNDTVRVVVHPRPELSSRLTNEVCSGTQFNYIPTSNTPGVVFTWHRANVPGITPAIDSGTGAIHETLINNLNTARNTQYIYTLRVGANCTYLAYVGLTVNPAPTAPVITIAPHDSLCTNTMYQNFGAAPLPSGINYHWSATNAFVYAESGNRQNALVNFNNPGDAVVMLSASTDSSSCGTSASYTVHVQSSVSDNMSVIYYNGQFICLRNDQDSYQWGWDDAITLDSTLIPGEINPNYFDAHPDFTYKHYWVMTTHGDCMQKTYFNTPAGVTNVNDDHAELKVFPNPASTTINVEINTRLSGNMQVEVLNMVGQKTAATTTVNNKASIDIANLPAGAYIIDCYKDGIKIAAAKFIKN